MAHNIDMSNNQANIAFLGSRNDVWHSLGQEMKEGQSIAEWAKQAGLEWDAIKVPAYFNHNGDLMPVLNASHIVRNDTLHQLGYVSDRYKIVQPREILAWFEQYISVDEHFQLDVAGSLKNGEIVWATAKYNGEITVGGDTHIARLLMTTTFDGTGSTINKASMTRVVCNNTLDAALSVKGGAIKTRHNAKFNADKVGEELGEIVKHIDQFKKMGDAMARVHFSKAAAEDMFKKLLDWPKDEKEVTTRKQNIFEDMIACYLTTVDEGTQTETKWTALNAVTRYVDHGRTVRNMNGNDTEARFLASQFGSGAAMKARAVELLLV